LLFFDIFIIEDYVMILIDRVNWMLTVYMDEEIQNLRAEVQAELASQLTLSRALYVIQKYVYLSG